MVLADGYTDVAPGKIASVVTSLQTFERLAPRAEPIDRPWSLRTTTEPSIEWYRSMFHRIGDGWLWFSRLQLNDDALRSIIHDPHVEIRAFHAGSRDEGMLELDYREPGECEIAFFGLTPPLLGQGAGRWMMNRALELAWSKPIRRLWLHTCSLDHPGALSFYLRTGFVAFRRQIEIADDPRRLGLVPPTAAPQVPRL